MNLKRYTFRQLEQIMTRECHRVTCRSCRQRCEALQRAIIEQDALAVAKNASFGLAEMATKRFRKHRNGEPNLQSNTTAKSP